MPNRFASIVTFSGTVQGVGFRRRAANIAARHPVVGYVKNLDDGTVEMFVEGNEEQCQQFVDQVKRDLCREIMSFESKVAAPLGLSEFTIQH